MTNNIREKINQSLSDFHIRQAARNWQRRDGAQRQLLRRWRSEGKIRRLDDLLRMLVESNIAYDTVNEYGITTVTVDCGMKLYYLPTGTIDWKRRPTTIRVEMEPLFQ